MPFFRETITGTSTIRAFGQEARFLLCLYFLNYILYTRPKRHQNSFFYICRFESHFLELVRRHLTANYASDMTNRHFFTGMNGNSRSRPSPGKSFPNFGKGFFHSLPVPEFWEGVSFIPYPILNIFLLLQFWLF